MNTEIVYTGKDNTIDLQLLENDAKVNLALISMVTVHQTHNGWTVTSNTSPDAFDWLSRASEGIIKLKLGYERIPTGIHNVTLIVHDSSNANGIVWGEFNIKVV